MRKSAKQQDGQAGENNYQPGHYKGGQDVVGKFKFGHLQQDEGRQGDIDDIEVQALVGFSREKVKILQQSSDEQEYEKGDNGFHDSIITGLEIKTIFFSLRVAVAKACL